CSGAYDAFTPVDPQRRFLRIEEGDNVEAYIQRMIDAGRLFVGIEGDEPMLANAVDKYGSGAFVFSSDFPHEVNIDTIRAEIDELLENEAVSESAKEDILYRNAARFYGGAWGAA
ncbi:MAG: amidohydrolase family protein, partial [Chloroflexi bacterium]|nr:amidohydrolase family protein [Chloroflexota bacterium]